MDADVREMAMRSFGYGRWDAPYWFIGPEQAQGRSEENDLKQRVKAWSLFGKYELDDCRAFHAQIRESRWHRNKPALQPTWRPLLILLMAFWVSQWTTKPSAPISATAGEAAAENAASLNCPGSPLLV